MLIINPRPLLIYRKTIEIAMAATHEVRFSGKVIETTVTNKGSEVDAWVRIMRRENPDHQIIVGLDCEWRPNTTSFTDNRTSTLQLCVGTKCLIAQLFYIDYIPQSLKDLLADPRFTFVGVEVARDVAKLENEYGLGCAKIEDVRELTLSYWPEMFSAKPGLKDIAYKVVGMNMPKPAHVCRSDWQSRVLNDDQVSYATIDAYASYCIGQRLLKNL